MTDDFATTSTGRARRLDLSPREAGVARSFAIDGLGIDQVAAEHGLSVQTVKSYLKRVRMKYRARGIDASSQLRLRLALERDAQE